MMQRTDISPLFTGGVGASSTLPLRNYYEKQHILPPRRLLDDRICAICRDAISAVSWAHSGDGILHPFHTECISEWMQYQPFLSGEAPKCPVCLNPLTPEDLKSLIGNQNRPEQIKELATLFLQNMLFVPVQIAETTSPLIVAISLLVLCAYILKDTTEPGKTTDKTIFSGMFFGTGLAIGLIAAMTSIYLTDNNVGQKAWAALCKHLLRKQEPLRMQDIQSARLAFRSTLMIGSLIALLATQKRVPSFFHSACAATVAGSLIGSIKTTLLLRQL